MITNPQRLLEYKLDFTCEFRKIVRVEGNKITYGINSRNDAIGDQAFEWDLDGSKRARWQKYLDNLDKLGTRGDLVYYEITMTHNPVWDGPHPFDKTPRNIRPWFDKFGLVMPATGKIIWLNLD